MKYTFILKNHRLLKVEKMCQNLRVSRSGYYDWINKKISKREKENLVLVKQIRSVFEESKRRFGAPKVHTKLQEEGIKIGKNRVARIMRENSMRSRVKRKFKITTHSKHNLGISPDLLRRNFKSSQPNKVWVSDITYIWTGEGWLYLAIILDLYNRKIVGWALSTRLKKAIIIRALALAIQRERPKEGLVFHSDKGSQYASKAFRRCLKENGFIQSMGKSGSYDNAVAESFFHLLKTELVYGKYFPTRAFASREVFEYIEVFYNRYRPHSANGNVPPVKYKGSTKAA